MTKELESNHKFPISWDEKLSCGCIIHFTDNGCGYYNRRDYCDFHKQAISKMKELLA